MAVVTIPDLRARFPTLTAPDELLGDIIELVGTISPCVDASYPESTAKLIQMYLCAHFGELSAGRRVKSQAAPSGASQSFDYGASGQGLSETAYGRMVLNIDTAGCAGALAGSQFDLLVVGGRNEP